MEVPGKMADTDKRENVKSLDILCEPCQSDNVNTPAGGFCKECEECMCKACFTQHLRLKSCRGHTCLDTKAYLETCRRTNDRVTKCKQHYGDIIKYYCRTHGAVGCGECMHRKHNACKADFIKDVSKTFQQNEEYKRFIRNIEKLAFERNTFETEIKDKKKRNEFMLKKALENVREFRSNVNEYLDKVESDIIAEANSIMKKNRVLLTKLENDCKLLSRKLKDIQSMLNSEKFKDNVLFINTIECKPKVFECEQAVSDMKTKSLNEYEFKRSQQLYTLVATAEKLGTLMTSTSPVLLRTSKLTDDKDERKRGEKQMRELSGDLEEPERLKERYNKWEEDRRKCLEEEKKREQRKTPFFLKRLDSFLKP